MTKRQSSLVAVVAILLVVFNVVIWVLPVSKTGVFWIADVFAIIAIGGQFITHHLAYNNTETLMSKFYGFPIVRVGYYYLVSQLVVSCVLVLLSVLLPIWLALIICIIMLAAATIGVIANDNTRDVIEAMDEHHGAQIVFMKRFYTRSKSIADTALNKEFKVRMAAFAEKIKYSDSVSSPDLARIEYDMWSMLTQIEAGLHNNNVAGATELLNNLENLLQERNNLCKLHKKRSTDQGTIVRDREEL